jgi:hypothetical protein
VRTINFTTRMGSYVLLHLKNYGLLSCWGATLERCQRQEQECCSPASSQGFIPLRNHSPVSLSPQVFRKILRLRQRTLTFRGEDCKDFLKKSMVMSFVCMLKSISMAPACCRSCTCVYDKYVQCFGAKNSVQFLWIDIHCPIFFFFFMDLLLKKFPWNLGCCFFVEFNTSSHWHGSIVS